MTNHASVSSQPMTHLAMCANERYAPGLEVTLRAFIRLTPRGAHRVVHIIDAGLVESTIARLKQCIAERPGFELNIVKAPFDRFDGLTLVNYPISAYLRLSMPEIITAAEVLYLDADAVPLSNPSEPLAIPSDVVYALTAASDRETLSPSQDSAEIASAHGLESCQSYFNSGVMGMNLRKLREINFTSKAVEFLNEFGKFASFADQSALNALLADQWKRVDPTWNTPAWAFDQQPDNQFPGILHYTNSAPWLQRHYRPSQALFERIAQELGVALPVPERGLRKTISAALSKWLQAPARIVWHAIKSAQAARRSDTKSAASERHIMQHWWDYLIGGPTRALRYRRRIREIRDPAFRVFPERTP